MNSLRATLIGILVGIGVVFFIYLIGMYGYPFLIRLIKLSISVLGVARTIALIFIIAGGLVGGIFGNSVFRDSGYDSGGDG